MSTGRSTDRSRSATCTSSWSPAAWPSVSFTPLKSSRSQNSTAKLRWSCVCRSRACATRSANSRRLASPVSWSWNACSCSCSSRAATSMTSRRFSTTVAYCRSSSRPTATAVMTSSGASGRVPRMLWMHTVVVASSEREVGHERRAARPPLDHRGVLGPAPRCRGRGQHDEQEGGDPAERRSGHRSGSARSRSGRRTRCRPPPSRPVRNPAAATSSRTPTAGRPSGAPWR